MLMITIPNYQILQQIYESANSLIYRGKRITDEQPVILKVLKQDYPTATQLIHYQQEYEIIASLTHVGIIKTYGLEKYHNSLVLILEDFGGKSLKHFLATVSVAQSPLESIKSINLTTFFSLALRITAILGAVHANHIIHKDINPSNIVFNPFTNQLKIIDFSIATRLAPENFSGTPAEGMEGTLPYLAPEQTGRMHCALDYRTDLYSLGITFYEMLTGRLPFTTTDALELIHCHLAKTPQPICEINPNVPLLVSDIVMKLLAKNVADRYQSAFGLQTDLEKCWTYCKDTEVLQEISELNHFKLGQNDFFGQLQLPEKLYGREQELQTLLQVFERVTNPSQYSLAKGHTEMVLVAGYGGVGKSSLVNQFRHLITTNQAYFIVGKYDRYQRDIPYAALTQAFNEFCQQLLTETDQQLAVWKQKILAAVAPNGQVLLEIIPKLQLVIGPQPNVASVGSQESQNRFLLVFQNFIRAVSQAEHPLVLFIEDWQWADLASLNLLKVLLTEPDIHHLLIIGGYRNNEVSASHPFAMTLAELSQQGAIIHTLELTNLSCANVNTLIADALHCDQATIQPLAELVYEKTLGNAFFTTTFLKALYEESLLTFDWQAQCWQWDLDKIHHKGMSNNVVELMVNKIQKCSPQTQSVLQLAACIGNRFDLQTLAVIGNQTAKSTLEALCPVLQEGLIISLTENDKLRKIAEENNSVTATRAYFTFQHDQIQQAAYALIPDSDKPQIHLEIGQLLLANTLVTTDLGKQIFEIVNHCNTGLALITDATDKIILARLNLQAGKQAKQATAYQIAIHYFALGMHLLGESAWQKHSALAFEFSKQQGECEFLVGNFAKADKFLVLALAKAQSKFEQADIYVLQLVQLAGQGKYNQAVATAREALNRFGMNLPALEQTWALQKASAMELALYPQNLNNRQIADLWNLPLMQNPAMQVCSKIIAIALDSIMTLGLPDLLAFYTTKLVNISLQHGLSVFTPMGYALFAVVLSNDFRDYEGAYQFAVLALQLNEVKLPNPSIRANIYYIYAYFSMLREHINISVDYWKNAYRVGLEVGNLVYAAYALAILPRYLFPSSVVAGTEAAQTAIAYFKQANNVPMLLLAQMCAGFGNSLQGNTLKPTSFNDDNFSESSYIEAFATSAPMLLAFYKRYKLQILTLFECYEQALPLVQERASWIEALGGLDYGFRSDYYLYAGITIVALYPVANPEEQVAYLAILDECLAENKLLSEQCPINFAHSYLILAAEQAKIEKRWLEAMQFYDQAIASAQEHGYRGNEALACELAAKFWLTLQKEDFAQLYSKGAHYAYGLWGATSKVNDLEKKYSHLRGQAEAKNHPCLTTQASMTTSSSHTLDFTSILKASQTLAGEIELSRLLEQLIKIVLENAGAERGVLLFEASQGQWVVEAEGVVEKQEIIVQCRDNPWLPDQPLSSPVSVPMTLIHYVAHAQESVVLHDIAQAGKFAQDIYFINNHIKSALGMPLLNQGYQTGILYLENSLTSGAFTSERLEVLNLLSAQIAISIENAKLYAKVHDSERRLQQFLEAIPVGVSVLDANGKAYYINQKALQILQPSVLAELTSSTQTEVYHTYLAGTKQPYSLENSPIVRALRGETTSVDDVEIQQGEQVIPLEMWGTPIFNDKQEVIYAITAFQDITERLQREKAEREREAAEAVNQQIMESIQYAKIIQTALLPNLAQVKTYLPNSFFIWQPRDIVGGDMLYTECFKDGFIVAVMDCTGHGVPGAFMTMIATTNLKRITQDEGYHAPRDILKRLNWLVKTALQQDSTHTDSNDGLDAAICWVKPYEHQLTFAGAKLPLYYIDDKQLFMIKGDKYSLGYKKSDLHFTFTTHTISIKPGSCFYLATDGLLDQLGGSKRLPFGNKRFGNLLIANHQHSFDKQSELLLQIFNEYQGDNERQDDVTVVGFGF